MWSEGPDSPVGYELILPPRWVQIPLDPTGRRAAIRTLVAAAIERAAQADGSVAPDQLTTAKLAYERDLGELAGQAATGGAIDLYVFDDVRHDCPLSAVLLITAVPRTAVPAQRDALLDRLLRAPGVSESDVTSLAGFPAIRIRRTERTRAGDGAPMASTATVVEYVLAVPYADDDLLLTFSTPVPEVAEEFVALFDAIAATWRWCWQPDSGL